MHFFLSIAPIFGDSGGFGRCVSTTRNDQPKSIVEYNNEPFAYIRVMSAYSPYALGGGGQGTVRIVLLV